jgi:hypothetical protein
MPKLPPTESLMFRATARMLRWLLVILFVLLVPTAGPTIAREFFPGLRASSSPVMLPVPELGWSTDGRSGNEPIHVRGNTTLPSPGPNQKTECDSERSEVRLNGGCWVKTEKPPPCPPGKQWEHEGRCWLPVAPAARVPTSGGSLPVSIAE